MLGHIKIFAEAKQDTLVFLTVPKTQKINLIKIAMLMVPLYKEIVLTITILLPIATERKMVIW